MKTLVCFVGLFVCTFGLHRHREIRSVTNGDFSSIDRYLEKFGYMSKVKSLTSHSSSERTDSLKSFQEFNRLPITGELDEATIKLMNTPRCGVADKVPGSPKPFNAPGIKWSKTTVTWQITGFTNDLQQAETKSEMARALQAWADVAGIRFTETTSNPDIQIFFASGSHGDNSPFDGPGGVLAHAYFPQNGDAHFDDGENWVVNRTGIDLFIVAAHEFGHSLGLEHSDNNAALMAPFYTGYIPNYQLHPDDIAGVRSLYGPNTDTTQAPPPATPAPPPPATPAPPPPATPAPPPPATPAPATPAPPPATPAPPPPATPAPPPPATPAPPPPATPAPPPATPAPPPPATPAPPPPATPAPPPPATPAPPPPAPPPPPSPPADNRPLYCKTGYRGTIQEQNGEYRFFMGNFVLLLNEQGLYRALPTRWYYRGAPRRPSAVFNIPGSQNTYFIRGRRVYEHNGDRRRIRMFWIRGGRRAMPERPSAAYATSATEVNVFGRTKVWTLDLTTRTVVDGSHQLISERFPGVTERCDAAMIGSDNKLHLFRSNKYRTFTFGTNALEGPLDAASEYIKGDCSLNSPA